MIRKLLFLILMTVMSSGLVVADQSLRLSGIMNGEEPTAIINDQILAVGDSVEGVRIIEIGSDFVKCHGAQGTFELKLNTSALVSKPKVPANSSIVATKDVKPSSIKSNSAKDLQARTSLNQSLELLKQADTLLKSPLVFERLYVKSAQLCDEAEREAQTAFRVVNDDAFRLAIKQHIDKVRQAKEMILKEKANLATHIRSLIAAHQIKTGMTSRDVSSSWGPPLMRNRDGQLEKWVYQDNNSNQKELVFRDDILIAY